MKQKFINIYCPQIKVSFQNFQFPNGHLLIMDFKKFQN
jgi:hypothetical protein